MSSPTPEVTIRIGTQDPKVVEEVLVKNEYRLGPFPPGAVVLDVGAHVGVFALACLAMGAADVVCVEPDPENFRLLAANVHRNLGRFAGRALLRRAAVWGPGVGTLHLADHGPRTAMHYAGEAPDRADLAAADWRRVPAVTLDDLIAPFAQVDLLKIDCEGGEWPALYESTLLGRVLWVVGEIHMGRPHPRHRCTPEAIVGHLNGLGFDAFTLPGEMPELNHWLYASRKGDWRR